MMVTSEAQMRSLIGNIEGHLRLEGEIVPEGLSLTRTEISKFWYFRDGKHIAILHERDGDGHVCFETQDIDA
jgi:hypothetical protein